MLELDYFIYCLTSSSQKYISKIKALRKKLYFMRECNTNLLIITCIISSFLAPDIMHFLF